MQLFKIRASAAGSIMTGNMGLTEKQEIQLSKLIDKATPLTDNQKITYDDLILKRDHPELPQTAKSYCELWLKNNLYDSHKELSTKYFQKGHENEDEAIDFVADQLGLGLLMKNEKHFDEGWFTGTPDVITKNAIIDVKNPWDYSTFPLFATEIPDMGYFYQGQIYMHLTGVHNYHLCYVLTDTPLHLIEREAWAWCRKQGIEELDEDILNRFISNMTYPGIDDSLKLKKFSFSYDPQVIKELEHRCKLCQKYIDSLMDGL